MAPQKYSNESLFDVLKKKDPSLASQIDKMKKIGVEDWIGLLRSDQGSHAGYPHLLDVERIADKIVPDRLKYEFTAGELFLLLSAIFLHDIGRIIPSDNPQNHHCESQKIIKEYGMALGLPDERIAQYCGLIAYCHCLEEPPTETECKNFRTTSLAHYGKLRIPLLAAILRIADETDNLWTRAVRDYWVGRFNKSKMNLGKAFRRYIEDIEFCHEGECLIVHVAELVDSDDGQSSGLSPMDLTGIQNTIESMRTVIQSGWGTLLGEVIRVYFREVYIEHANRLYKEFDPASEPPPLKKVLDKEDKDKDMKVSLDALFEAATKLSLGTFGHCAFTWQALEAQIGRPLTDAEKWLALRMGSVSPHFRVIGNLESEELHIELDRGQMNEIRAKILGN